jgi:hypothetical protein
LPQPAEAASPSPAEAKRARVRVRRDFIVNERTEPVLGDSWWRMKRRKEKSSWSCLADPCVMKKKKN